VTSHVEREQIAEFGILVLGPCSAGDCIGRQIRCANRPPARAVLPSTSNRVFIRLSHQDEANPTVGWYVPPFICAATFFPQILRLALDEQIVPKLEDNPPFLREGLWQPRTLAGERGAVFRPEPAPITATLLYPATAQEASSFNTLAHHLIYSFGLIREDEAGLFRP